MLSATLPAPRTLQDVVTSVETGLVRGDGFSWGPVRTGEEQDHSPPLPLPTALPAPPCCLGLWFAFSLVTSAVVVPKPLSPSLFSGTSCELEFPLFLRAPVVPPSLQTPIPPDPRPWADSNTQRGAEVRWRL